jgi:hypothetical protein
MNNTFHHLIAKHGVLTAFSIAKKVSPEDIKKFRAKIKKKCKDPKEFNQLLKEEITRSTQESIAKNSIPGLIVPSDIGRQPQSKFCNGDEKKIMKLNNMSNVIATKFVDADLSKDEICYIMLSILTALGLTDADFKEFHQKYGPPDDRDDRDESDDDDDDGEEYNG